MYSFMLGFLSHDIFAVYCFSIMLRSFYLLLEARNGIDREVIYLMTDVGKMANALKGKNGRNKLY